MKRDVVGVGCGLVGRGVALATEGSFQLWANDLLWMAAHFLICKVGIPTIIAIYSRGMSGGLGEIKVTANVQGALRTHSGLIIGLGELTQRFASGSSHSLFFSPKSLCHTD